MGEETPKINIVELIGRHSTAKDQEESSYMDNPQWTPESMDEMCDALEQCHAIEIELLEAFDCLKEMVDTEGMKGNEFSFARTMFNAQKIVMRKIERDNKNGDINE